MIFAETERLRLRKVREDDLEPLVASWSDPEMSRYTGIKPDVRAFLTQLIADMQVKKPGDQEPSGPWYQYIVERKSDGEIIGDLGAAFEKPGERQVEIGYRIFPAFHRHGYAREAVAGLISHLIAEHQVHRFVGQAAALNDASTGLLRSLGFRLEGQLLKSFLCFDEWIDTDYYALLAEEWKEPVPSPAASRP